MLDHPSRLLQGMEFYDKEKEEDTLNVHDLGTSISLASSMMITCLDNVCTLVGGPFS